MPGGARACQIAFAGDDEGSALRLEPPSSRLIAHALLDLKKEKYMRISKEDNLVTLITSLRRPLSSSNFVDHWVRFTEEIRNEPGYVGTALHKSTDGTRVINYAHWRSQAGFEGFLKRYRVTSRSSVRTPRASIPTPTTSSISMSQQK